MAARNSTRFDSTRSNPDISILRRERTEIEAMGRNLEAALSGAQQVDKEISRTLVYSTSWVRKVPLLRDLWVQWVQVRPLEELEGKLRTSVHNSVDAIAQLGEQIYKENERLETLRNVYNTAKEESWTADQYLAFIEQNTDLTFIVQSNGGQYDIKELFKTVDQRLGPSRPEEKKREYAVWLQKHIQLTEQYIEGMNMLCVVGGDWVAEMSRSYFDLTNLRDSMDIIKRTLNHLNKGGIASVSSEVAIRDYGLAYVAGMKTLVQGFYRINDLRQEGNDSFGVALDDLRKTLEHGLPKLQPEQNRYLPAAK
jgi:hypothetical protein